MSVSEVDPSELVVNKAWDTSLFRRLLEFIRPHRRLFLASMGLDIIAEAGRIESVEVQGAHTIVVSFESAASQPHVSILRLRVEQPAVVSGNRPPLTVTPSAGWVLKRGAWEAPAATQAGERDGEALRSLTLGVAPR